MKKKKIKLITLTVIIGIICFAVAEAHANIVDFAPNGVGWSLQGYAGCCTEPTIINSAGRLELNAQGYYASKSAFFNTPQDISSFTASFIWYTGTTYDGYNPGDGFTFVVQNAGPGYLGAVGGGLGYEGMPNSAGIAFNMMLNSEALVSNGIIGNYASVNPVVLHSRHAIGVSVAYDGSNLATTIVDNSTGDTWYTNYAIDIPQTVGGSTAYVGFTAGSGRAYGNQFVEDLMFTSVAPEPISSTLFITGGTLLVARSYIRKNKKA